MKNKTFIGIILALFVITTACQKKDNVSPRVQQENQDIKKAVPVEKVRVVVGHWREDLTENPNEHFNRITLKMPNEFGDGSIKIQEIKKVSEKPEFELIKSTEGEYFTYELDLESIPNLKDLEEKYGEPYMGLSMTLNDGTYVNYAAFIYYYPKEELKEPSMYWIEAPIDGSQPINPRVLQGDH